MDFESFYDDLFGGVSDLFSGVGKFFESAVPDIATEPEVVNAAEDVAAAGKESSLLDQAFKVFEKGEDEFANWVKGMPKEQQITLGLLLKGGAEGAMRASAQRSENEQRNRELDRKENMSRVNPSTTTYSQRPVPGGLVSPYMGGG